MGKFHQSLTELSACDTSRFLFPDDNFSKYQLIFTKLAMCIDVVESAVGMLMGKFHKLLTVIFPGYDSGRVLSFHVFIFLRKQGLGNQTPV